MSSTLISAARRGKATHCASFIALLSGLVALSPCLAEDVGRSENAVTRSSPTEKYPYALKGYYASNNAWGMKDQVDGVDYSTSVTLDPAHFERGASFSWKYPRNVGRVFGYPHIGYDPRAAGVSSAQGANIANLSVNYDVRLSDTANSTAAFDIWFNSQPNGSWATTSTELLVEVHPTSRPSAQRRVLERLRHIFAKPEFASPPVLTGIGFAGATLHISHPNESGASWRFIDVKMPEDVMSGSLSLSNIIKELIWDGVMTGQEYLTSLQFGSEVLGGSGSLQINNLAYHWTATPTLVGTSGDETFPMTSKGGNHAIGNGGIDTAIYAGSYENYQIKSDGTKILMMAKGSVSTLDVLEGISFVKFSNGTYDTKTKEFVPNSRTQ